MKTSKILTILTACLALSACVKEEDLGIVNPDYDSAKENGKIYFSSATTKGHQSVNGNALSYTWDNVTADTEGKMHMAMGVNNGLVSIFDNSKPYSYVNQTATSDNYASLNSVDALQESISGDIGIYFFAPLSYEDGAFTQSTSNSDFSFTVAFPTEFDNTDGLEGSDFKENLLVYGKTTATSLSAVEPNELSMVTLNPIPACLEFVMTNNYASTVSVESIEFTSNNEIFPTSLSITNDVYTTSTSVKTVTATLDTAVDVERGESKSFYVYVLPYGEAFPDLTEVNVTVNYSGEQVDDVFETLLPSAGSYEAKGYYSIARTAGNILTFADFETGGTYSSDALPEENTWYIVDDTFDSTASTAIKAALARAATASKEISIDFSGSTFATMPSSAFASCTALVSVKGLESMTASTSTMIFEYCSNLKTVEGLINITTLNNSAMRYSGITSLNIPNVTTIGNNTFTNCTALTELTMATSSNILSIGTNSFQNDSSADNILAANIALTTYSEASNVVDNVVTAGATVAFLSINGVEAQTSTETTLEGLASTTPTTDEWIITDSEAATGIDAVFSALATIEDSTRSIEISFPNLTALYIAQEAFSSISRAISDVTITAKFSIDMPKVTTISGNTSSVFADYTTLTELSMPKLETVPMSFVDGCTALSSLDLSSATSIGDFAFENCSKLETLSLPYASSVADYAFSSTGLTSLTLASESTLISLGEHSFGNNNEDAATIALITNTDHTINVNVLTVEGVSATFRTINGVGVSLGENEYYLSDVTTENLPTGNTWIFIDSSLTESCFAKLVIALNASTEESVSVTFKNATTTPTFTTSTCVLNAVTTPFSVDFPAASSIGAYTFYQCTALTNISFTDNQSETIAIVGNAFNGCTGLTSLTLDNVTSIAASAFINCSGLTYVSMASLSSLPNYAFNGCTSLDEAVFSNVTSLATGTFANSTLNKLTLSQSALMTSMGSNAFGSIDLTTVELTIYDGNTISGNVLTVDSVDYTFETINGNGGSVENGIYLSDYDGSAAAEGSEWNFLDTEVDLASLANLVSMINLSTEQSVSVVFNKISTLPTCTSTTRVLNGVTKSFSFEASGVATIPAYFFFEAAYLTKATFESATTINGYAFTKIYAGLTELTLSTSTAMSNIVSTAFNNTTISGVALTISELNTISNNVLTIGSTDWTFATINGNGAVVEDGIYLSDYDGTTAPEGNEWVFLDESVDATAVTKIATLLNLSKETSVNVILKNITSIPAYSSTTTDFSSMTRSFSFEAPKIATVPAYLFYGCTGLTKAVFESATATNKYAFTNCTSLKELTLSLTTEMSSITANGMNTSIPISEVALTIYAGNTISGNVLTVGTTDYTFKTINGNGAVE